MTDSSTSVNLGDLIRKYYRTALSSIFESVRVFESSFSDDQSYSITILIDSIIEGFGFRSRSH